MKDDITRRRFLQTAAWLGFGSVLAGPLRTPWAAEKSLDFGPAERFSFDMLVDKARGMAERPYEPPLRPAPDIIKKIDYEEWGKIRYNTNFALFGDAAGVYPVTFFHLGMFFQKSVNMYAVDDGKARRILYNNRYFDMPKDSVARKLPEKSGFAGFRLQESRKRDDWRTQD